jgi:hypothetical protein
VAGTCFTSTTIFNVFLQPGSAASATLQQGEHGADIQFTLSFLAFMEIKKKAFHLLFLA